MTDPQDDVPCRDCGRPTQHATEICADCRTPAGRLVTALAAMGVKAKADTHCDVNVGIIAITVEEEEWTISSMEATHAETVEAAASAIAAIVQAPGLRAENATLAAEVKRLREELEKPTVGPWRRELFGNQVRWHASAGEGDRIAAIARAPGDWRGGWIVRGFWGAPDSSGPETSDAGRHASDLALIAAGYRLVGGVHPLPDEVPDAR